MGCQILVGQKDRVWAQILPTEFRKILAAFRVFAPFGFWGSQNLGKRTGPSNSISGFGGGSWMDHLFWKTLLGVKFPLGSVLKHLPPPGFLRRVFVGTTSLRKPLQNDNWVPESAPQHSLGVFVSRGSVSYTHLTLPTICSV